MKFVLLDSFLITGKTPQWSNWNSSRVVRVELVRQEHGGSSDLLGSESGSSTLGLTPGSPLGPEGPTDLQYSAVSMWRTEVHAGKTYTEKSSLLSQICGAGPPPARGWGGFYYREICVNYVTQELPDALRCGEEEGKQRWGSRACWLSFRGRGRQRNDSAVYSAWLVFCQNTRFWFPASRVAHDLLQTQFQPI